VVGYQHETCRFFIFMKNSQTVKILLIFVLILAISACSRNKNSGNAEDDWENEVLLASECGMDGLRCCAAPEEACRYGQQCCSDPLNVKNNFCADNCTLGSKHAFCRATEPKCDEGFACQSGRCIECGKDKGPCCAGENSCESGLVCSNEICEKCGLPGNVCCTQGLPCQSEKLRTAGRTECRENACSFCGSSGSVSCLGDPKCNPGNLLNNDSCFMCGGLNQPCCEITDVNLYDCNPKEGLVCNVGFCVSK
jgi:hypothetical protein